MKITKTIFGWTAGVLMLGATLTTQGGLIAAWTFDSQVTPSGLAPNNDVTYNPSGVSASLTAVGGVASIGNTPTVGATTLNDPRGTPITAFALAVGFSPSSTVTIQVANPTGLSGFSLSYAAADLNGAGTQDWKWSTDGITYNGLPDAGASLGINTSTWSLNSVNFNNASGSTLFFQNTVAAGFVGFDNFQVTAVPEPINYALAGFGLCVGGISFGRRFVRKLTRA
jgi:hypothetical protein